MLRIANDAVVKSGADGQQTHRSAAWRHVGFVSFRACPTYPGICGSLAGIGTQTPSRCIGTRDSPADPPESRNSAVSRCPTKRRPRYRCTDAWPATAVTGVLCEFVHRMALAHRVVCCASRPNPADSRCSAVLLTATRPSGMSTTTGPGRPLRAIWKAFFIDLRHMAHILDQEIVLDDRASNAHGIALLEGIQTDRMRRHLAGHDHHRNTSPCRLSLYQSSALVTPGPEVTKATPTSPVARA